MILSVDAEKTFENVEYPFMIKILKKVGLEATHLNIIKTIYKKPTTNIILNGEEMRAFPLWSGTRQGCLLLPLIFNIALEALTSAIKIQKEIKGI